jgi:iron complex outermembrane receptor protein
LNEHEQWSQELRYAGSFGAADVTTGLYYLDQELLYIDERNFSPSFRRVGGGQGQFESWAGFANIDWRTSSELTLSAGLRYTHEQKVSRISRVRRAIDDLDGPGVDIPGEGVIGGDIDRGFLAFSDAPFEQTWEDVSPRLAVQWRPQPDTNLYASAARAFRSGGVNFRTSSLGLAPRAYEPEAQTTLELGWKQRLAGGRGHLAIALFHNSIEDMQRETNLADPVSGVQQVVLNAGDAAIYGGEIEARFTINDNFSVSAQAGYVEGAYDRVTQDLNGDLVIDDADSEQSIPRLAPWSYGFDLTYAAPVLAGSVSARLGYHHRDSAFYNDTNLGRLAEVDMVDANLSYASDAGGWRLSLYGENLLNDAAWGGDTTLPSSAAFGYSGGERPTFSPLNKGRVIGIEVRWSE